MTPAELRAEADEADAQAEQLEADGEAEATKLRAAFASRAAIARDQAMRLRKLADDLEGRTRSLTSEHRHNTLDDVSTTLSSNALRSQAQIVGDAKKHRLVLAMAKRGLSFADVADALGARLKPRSFPRSTVQSWVKPKGDVAYRAIPQDAAEALKAMYGVPLSAWPRVIPGT